MTRKLQGIIVPLVTPLATPDTIDPRGTRNTINHVIQGGVDAIFLLGSTGEGPALTVETQHRFLEIAMECVAGRCPVLVGISSASAVETLELGRFAARCGADAVVAAPPCYLPADDRELYNYFERLAGETELPLYLYNMPALTKVTLHPALVERLAKIPGIAGYKDSSGDLNAFADVIRRLGGREDFSLLTGPEALTATTIRMGGDGGVNGGANLRPEIFRDLYQAVQKNDAAAEKRAQAEILELQKLYDSRPGTPGVIRGLKHAMAQQGLLKNILAFPGLPLD